MPLDADVHMVPRPPLAKGAPATAAQTSQEVVCLDWHNVLQHRNELFLRDEERAALRKALSCHKFRIWVISFVGRDRRRKTDELMSRCLAPVRAAFPNLLGWFTITKKVGEGGKVHQALDKGCRIIVDDNDEILKEANEVGMVIYPIVTVHQQHTWWEGPKYTNLTAAVDDLVDGSRGEEPASSSSAAA